MFTLAHLRRCDQRGQIAPIALFGVLIASAVLVMMFNVGTKVTEKSQVANAADAAAYSGAVWTARHLNFMAYTNRAMVANHIGVGHFVSYVSWVRYIDETIDAIEDYARFIPYAGEYVTMVEEIIAEVRSFTEESAEVAIPIMDTWNASYRAAQVETQASLALNNLTELMRRTAQAHDPNIRINDRNEFSAMPSALRTAIDARLLSQLASVPTFVERYSADEDEGGIEQLIGSSMRANGDTTRWIAGERGWRFNSLMRQFRKQGSTSHSQSEDAADWEAADQLQSRKRDLTGWGSWRDVGPGAEASASEFDDEYEGVPNYYNVAGEPDSNSLQIAAIATRRQSTTANRAFRDVGRTGAGADSRSVIAAAALARVEFRRPTDGGFASLGRAQEYSNLFNPFWEARLAEADLGLGL
ncbi:MAG TPA: pilus assembly protein TadG-related protein [Steroidobacteraceae bacterium]|nr:pilus assembly protein TadG-related protein [Steroidobacteraceae bacterium]